MSNHYNYTVIARGTLASSMDATQLTLALGAGAGSDFPTGPCTVTISTGTLTVDPTLAQLKVAETIEVESRSGDSFVLVARDINGNASPLTHASGSLVQLLWTPADASRLQGKLDALEILLQRSLGSLTTGVQSVYPNYDQLKIVPQDTPDMTVKVKTGAGFALSKTCYLVADFTTPTIVAPITYTRHDLISIDSATDLIVVTTGSEEGAVPATPAGHIPLADVTIIVSQSSIVTGDISDVRETY